MYKKFIDKCFKHKKLALDFLEENIYSDKIEEFLKKIAVVENPKLFDLFKVKKNRDFSLDLRIENNICSFTLKDFESKRIEDKWFNKEYPYASFFLEIIGGKIHYTITPSSDRGSTNEGEIDGVCKNIDECLDLFLKHAKEEGWGYVDNFD